MVAILGFSREKVIAAVQEMYTAVATAPEQPYHFPVGRDACLRLGYPQAELEGVPDDALRSFAGVGYPFRSGVIRAGDRVLDVGAGAGTDTLVAARLVGRAGKIWALDMTPAMTGKLLTLVARHGIGNVTVIEGNAERLPLPDASVDVVTSNGMLNLVPDKRSAIAEMFRVLRPGGRVQIADIVIRRPVTLDCATDPKLWAECVVGATVDEDYLQLFRDAGFEDVSVLHDFDYFALSRSAETRDIARRFGARAIEITMRRGAAAPRRILQALRRLDPRRTWASIRRRGLQGSLALALAILACYGTLAAIGLLSLAGIALTVNPALWAGTIVLFASLAAVGVAGGMRLHGARAPAGFAAAGAGVIAYVQLLDYGMALELLGLALLAVGVLLDWRARRKLPAAGS